MEKTKRCRVLSVISQKGGVGKSATATQLAVGLARKKHKVLFIDADAQFFQETADLNTGYAYAEGMVRDRAFQMMPFVKSITEGIRVEDVAAVLPDITAECFFLFFFILP